MRLVRLLIAIGAALLLAACASPEPGRFYAGAYGGVSGGAAAGR